LFRRGTLLAALVLQVVLSVNIFAQTGRITGRVTDASNGKPLEGVSATVGGTQAGAATSEDGKFTILNVPVGTYSITFNRLGYAPATIPEVVVSPVTPANVAIELTPVAIAGAAVTIRAGLFDQQVKAPPGVTTLTAEEIRRFPGGFEDVVRTIATLPGVAVVSTG